MWRRRHRSTARYGYCERRARHRDESRIPRALVLDAPSVAHRLATRADRAYLLAAGRAGLQYDRSLHRATSAKARRIAHHDSSGDRLPAHVMRPTSSLRSRVLFGSVLWSLGLFVVVSLALTQLMLRYPNAPRMVHEALSHVGIVSVVALLCLAVG